MELIELKTKIGDDIEITPAAAAVLSNHSDRIDDSVVRSLRYQALHNNGQRLQPFDVETALVIHGLFP